MYSTRAVKAEQQDQWFKGLKNGSLQAFKSIFDAYTPALCTYAAMYLEGDQAEDAVQDILYSLWERRNDLQLGSGELSPYLFGAVRRKALQIIRNEKRRGEKRHEIKVEVVESQSPVLPDAALESGDVQWAIGQALEELTDIQREVVRLRYTEGLSYGDIAEILDISRPAAIQYSVRIKNKLRPILAKYLGRNR